jgi:hypothetical protein
MVLVLYNSQPSAGVQALSQQLQDKQISKKKKKSTNHPSQPASTKSGNLIERGTPMGLKNT